MFKEIEGTIINLSQIQSIESSGLNIKIVFINGKEILIHTEKYDYIINGPGRTTNAMWEQYEEHMKHWQKITIQALYTSITLKG